MPMPKAPVNEYNSVMFPENKIWFTRQGRLIQSKPEAAPMQC
jgi:hypothetical protein